jgi:uncharacterized phage protein gp47/JayE
MPTYGLLPEGFFPATMSVIREEIETDMRAEFGTSLPMGDGTLLGFLIGILAERLALLWEVAEAVNSSQDPDKATGAALEALCLLTATFRIAAGASVATLTLCGDDGTVVAAGNIVATASTGKEFETAVDCTIALLTDWAPTTAYNVNDRRKNSGRCYKCITAGVSDGAGGPTTTADDIIDGTVHWRYLGEGEGAVDVVAVSLETGEIVALSGDLTDIRTPIGGWDSARNLLDAELGRDVQVDEDLRLLREAELSQTGTGTPDAIRAALLSITGVTSATVFYNNTDVVDGDGLTPHSTECMVQGGVDQDIWDTLWDNVPVGIATIGTEVGLVTDDEGNSQTLKFSRPTTIDIYVRMSLTKNVKTYEGDTIVEEKIVLWGADRSTGDDVHASAVTAQAFAVNGLIDVTETLIYTDVIGAPVAWAPTTAYVATVGARSVVTNDGRTYICTTGGNSAGAGGPTGTGTAIADGTCVWRFLGASIPITTRQLPLYDTSRITIVSSSATP